MKISEFFQNELIITNLAANQKEEVFRELYNKLYESSYVKESFLNAIIEREKKFPTGLQLSKYNVAIPHTDAEHVLKPAIAMATLAKPVVFKNMANPQEDINVSIVFMLALNAAHSQVEMLQQLIELIQNELFIKKLLKAKGGGEVIDAIKKEFV